MSIYDETPKKTIDKKSIDDPHKEVSDALGNLLEFDDSVVYITGELSEYSLCELMIKVRALLKHRTSKDYKGDTDAPINLIINTNGGDVYEMLGIIDYIKNLDIKVNTICRGKAMSAGAVILACGSGQRMASKHSTIMFHEASSINVGKQSDQRANIKHVDNIENMSNTLLAEVTKKDVTFWKENTRTDLYLTAAEALELGVIDLVI